MTEVNGWYSANQRIAVGIESVGTNPLPSSGSSTRIVGALLAVSTLFAFSPSAAASQMSAREKSARSPMAASHSTGVALGGTRPTAPLQ